MMSDAEFDDLIDTMPGSLANICRVVRHYVKQGTPMPTVMRVDAHTYECVLHDIKVWNTMAKNPVMEIAEWPVAKDGAPMIGSIRLEPMAASEIAEHLNNPHPEQQLDAFVHGPNEQTEATVVRRRQSFPNPGNN